MDSAESYENGGEIAEAIGDSQVAWDGGELCGGYPPSLKKVRKWMEMFSFVCLGGVSF